MKPRAAVAPVRFPAPKADWGARRRAQGAGSLTRWGRLAPARGFCGSGHTPRAQAEALRCLSTVLSATPGWLCPDPTCRLERGKGRPPVPCHSLQRPLHGSLSWAQTSVHQNLLQDKCATLCFYENKDEKTLKKLAMVLCSFPLCSSRLRRSE